MGILTFLRRVFGAKPAPTITPVPPKPSFVLPGPVPASPVPALPVPALPVPALTPPCPERTTSEKADPIADTIVEAGLRWIQETTIPQAMWPELIHQAKAGIQDGRSYRDSCNAWGESLKGIKWEWSGLSIWQEQFRKQGEWPSLWAGTGLDEEQDPDENSSDALPSTLEAFVKATKVEELKEIIRSLGRLPRPQPRKRTEWEVLAQKVLSWEDVAAKAEALSQQMREAQNAERQRALADLLAHTVEAAMMEAKKYGGIPLICANLLLQ